jgi:hypothetical protein
MTSTTRVCTAALHLDGPRPDSSPVFGSATPNKMLWNGLTLGHLQSPDMFATGGWWHDSSLLAATGEGIEKEEPRAWEGWWNEQIVALVELSMQQKDALSVLLTGRSESAFSELIKRMVRSKKLDFDMVCLKPATGPANQKFNTTMQFKQELLKDIVYTYKDAEEIRIYEDRVKHTKGFRDFFFQFNKDLMSGQIPISRKPIIAEVIQVTEAVKNLNPVTEVAEIQRMLNAHNALVKAGTAPRGAVPYQIKKTVFYTGYMIPQAMTDKLLSLVKLPPGTSEGNIRYLANNILVTPKKCPPDILKKVGGIGNKVVWKVTGVSCFENKIWAARVEPVPDSQKIYSENPIPTIVLAVRKNAQPSDASRITNWHPVPDEQSFLFESIVGEKMLLRIEEEHANENQWESYFPNKQYQKHPREDNHHDRNGNANGSHSNHFRPYPPRRDQDDRRPSGPSNYRGGNRERGRGNRNAQHGPRGGRGGGGGYRGNQGGGRGRGRGGGGGGGNGGGGGGQSNYRSLDDVGDRSHGQDTNPDSYY